MKLMQYIKIISLVFLAPMASAQTVTLPALYDVVDVASNDSLNIRDLPNSSGNILGELRYNQTSVEVLAFSNDRKWGKVSLAEKTGWTSMRFLEAQGFQDATSLPEWLNCSGTEPFWSVDITSSGTSYAKWNMDSETEYEMSWSDFSRNTYTSTYGFRLEGVKDVVHGIIKREQCSDGMSDLEYGFSFEAIRSRFAGSELYSGCCSLR